MQLETDGCRAVIDPEYGGRLTSFSVDGRELLVREGKDMYHWGSFVMAPWVGRLRGGAFSWNGREHRFPLNAGGHALHGLVTPAPWQEVGPGTVAVDLPEPWPWRGRLVHSMELEPGLARFRLELTAEEPMPAALGWHPWFLREIAAPDGSKAGPVVLNAQPRAMYGNDETGLPSGELVPPPDLPWDYAFVDLTEPPRATWPGFLELTVESSCPIYVLYDWEPQGICIEPWTAPPNSLNMPGQAIVRPGEPLVATMTWRWRRLIGVGGQ
jgi:aldose 1-epimerase